MCLCRRQASASSLLFSSLLISSLLFSSLLPISATPLFRVSTLPVSLSSSKPSPPSPPTPYPPMKTPVRVFQFPIHSARNPSRRLRHSISLASTHTRAHLTKSFPVSARRMEIQSHTLIAQLNLSALYLYEESAHWSITFFFCFSLFS